MKKIFFTLVAVATLASCANEETVMEAPHSAIEFGNVFVDNATRADYSTGLKLERFLVYGTVTGTAGTVNIYDGDLVTGTIGNQVWNCEETNYWIPGASYNFAAVADQTATIRSDEKDENGMPLLLHTLGDSNTNLKDMLYAEASVAGANVTETYNTPVNFTFQHLLSKAKFTVTSTAANGYSHTVTGITVANYSFGTYTIATETWAGNTAKDVPFAEISGVTAATGAKSNAEVLLVPNAAQFNVTFTVDLYKGNTKLGTETKTIPVDADLVKGNAYNFTIECRMGNEIKFKVENDPSWNPETGGTEIAIQ